jgi:hypothetical protein
MLNSLFGLSDKTSMMGTNENPQTLNSKAGPKPNKKPEQPSSLKGGIGRARATSFAEPPHLQSSKSTTNTSTHTTNTNTTNTTNTINTVNTTNTTIIHPQHIQKQIGQVSDDRRPQLIDRMPQVINQLERDLTTGLKEKDISLDEGGVYLFNLNQTAYIIEGSKTPDEKRSVRDKVLRELIKYNIEHVMVRVPGGCKFIV